MQVPKQVYFKNKNIWKCFWTRRTQRTIQYDNAVVYFTLNEHEDSIRQKLVLILNF